MKLKTKIMIGAIFLVIIISFISVYGREKTPTISVKQRYTWMATEHSGNEDILTFSYIHEQFSGRTQLCLIAKEGIPVGFLPKYINIYDENDVFLYSIDRELIDIPDPDIWHRWGFCRSFDSEIDPHYLKWGENSVIFEYLEVDAINYNTNWLDSNVTLYIYSPPNSSVVGNIYVYQLEDNWKFGANHTNTTSGEINSYKYVLESTVPIKEYGYGVYIINKNETSGLCYENPFEECISEDPKYDFDDICKAKMKVNQSYAEDYYGWFGWNFTYECTSDDYYRKSPFCEVDFDPNCEFNLSEDGLKLEVYFDSIHDDKLNYTPIDPLIAFSLNSIEASRGSPINENMYALVWCDETQDDVTYAIYYTNNTVYKSATDVDANSGLCQFDHQVDVTTKDYNEFIISWWSYTAGGDVKIKHYNLTSNTSGEVIISEGSTAGYTSSVSAFNESDFVVAWYNSTSYTTDSKIYTGVDTLVAYRTRGSTINDWAMDVDAIDEEEHLYGLCYFTYFPPFSPGWIRMDMYNTTGDNRGGITAASNNAFGFNLQANAMNSSLFGCAYANKKTVDNPAVRFSAVPVDTAIKYVDEIPLDYTHTNPSVGFAPINSTAFAAAWYDDDAEDDATQCNVWTFNGTKLNTVDKNLTHIDYPYTSVFSLNVATNFRLCDDLFGISWSDALAGYTETMQPNLTDLPANYKCSTCIYYNGQGDWDIDCSDNCLIQEENIAEYEGNENINIIGEGVTTFSGVTMDVNDLMIMGDSPSAKCEVNLMGGGKIN